MHIFSMLTHYSCLIIIPLYGLKGAPVIKLIISATQWWETDCDCQIIFDRDKKKKKKTETKFIRIKQFHLPLHLQNNIFHILEDLGFIYSNLMFSCKQKGSKIQRITNAETVASYWLGLKGFDYHTSYWSQHRRSFGFSICSNELHQSTWRGSVLSCSPLIEQPRM